MSSTSLYVQYQERFGRVPAWPVKMAPVWGTVDELQQAFEKALATGEPIRDWTPFMEGSHAPSAETPKESPSSVA